MKNPLMTTILMVMCKTHYCACVGYMVYFWDTTEGRPLGNLGTILLTVSGMITLIAGFLLVKKREIILIEESFPVIMLSIAGALCIVIPVAAGYALNMMEGKTPFVVMAVMLYAALITMLIFWRKSDEN